MFPSSAAPISFSMMAVIFSGVTASNNAARSLATWAA
jgi:hypothetical protein